MNNLINEYFLKVKATWSISCEKKYPMKKSDLMDYVIVKESVTIFKEFSELKYISSNIF